MCGIVGLVGKLDSTAEGRMSVACDVMAHRGPDDAGLWSAEEVILGFRRLAIIDLSPAGHQPMVSRDGQRTLVFNGEIYNYRELTQQLASTCEFQSQTDSEVLLHGFREWGWGGLLQRIDGMFAFAIWDAVTRRLYAARDRVGEKPLYYRKAGGSFCFASTLESLLVASDAPRQVDPMALDAYLTYQSVPAPFTMYDGVRHLLPAHSLQYAPDSDQLTITRYWDVSYANKVVRSEPELLEELDGLVRRAVSRRMISDVPLGAFLSGGVDSSLVTALMAQESSQPVEAVVMGFDDPDFDERKYARQVAQKWGARLHEAVVGPDLLAALPEMVWQLGQPNADVSVVPTFAVARAAKQHVTVVLNGDGGDELFGGYSRPVVTRAAEHYRRLPLMLRSAMARAMAGQDQGRLRKLSLLTRAGRGEAVDGFTYDRGFRRWRKEAYGPALSAMLDTWHPDSLYRDAWNRAQATDDTDRALYGDFVTYLPNQLLIKMDVATMAFAVEARAPLLDKTLIEFAATIPTHQRLKAYETKHLLKKLTARYVPAELVYRRKRGFVAPVSKWLRTGYLPLLRRVLDGASFKARGWINPHFVRRMLSEHEHGVRDWTDQLWALLVLETWARIALDGTLKRHDPLAAMAEPSVTAAASMNMTPRHSADVKRVGPEVRTIQVGMGWFDEEAGGLNRFYKELLDALPGVGVSVDGVVIGSRQVVIDSAGAVEAVSKRQAMFKRFRSLRSAVLGIKHREPGALLVSHFALYARPLIRDLKVKPFVVHFHGPWALETKMEGAGAIDVMLRRTLERTVYRRANRCIVLSDAFASVLHQEYGVPRDRIRVIPGAVDVDRFDVTHTRDEARMFLGWPPNRRIVLSVRRLVRRMGLEALIDSVAEIVREVPDVLVVIAGMGPLRSDLERRIERLAIQDHVRLIGFVPDEHLPLAYRASDLSVVPTAALEGFGLIVAESLAAGTPAMVTPVGALPEVVRGLCSELILRGLTSRDIKNGLSAALTGAIVLPTAEQCKRFTRERYSWPVIAAQVRQVYVEALS